MGGRFWKYGKLLKMGERCLLHRYRKIRITGIFPFPYQSVKVAISRKNMPNIWQICQNGVYVPKND